MNTEDEIKRLIESKYGNVKNFSIQNNIPYTTVRSMSVTKYSNSKACLLTGFLCILANKCTKVTKRINTTKEVFIY